MMGWMPGDIPLRPQKQALQVLRGLQIHAAFWQTPLS